MVQYLMRLEGQCRPNPILLAAASSISFRWERRARAPAGGGFVPWERRARAPAGGGFVPSERRARAPAGGGFVPWERRARAPAWGAQILALFHENVERRDQFQFLLEDQREVAQFPENGGPRAQAGGGPVPWEWRAQSTGRRWPSSMRTEGPEHRPEVALFHENGGPRAQAGGGPV